MADLRVEKFDMINPFVVAASPATQGYKNVVKIAKSRPGAIVLRNFGHGAGGGSYVGPDANAMYTGKEAFHSHGIGNRIDDSITTLEQYCQEIRKIKKEIDSDIKLWVSVGHYSDIIKGRDYKTEWVKQAKEITAAGADALELHFNTPGVAVSLNRVSDYYSILDECIRLIKNEITSIPVMVKLAVEGCDPFTSLKIATEAGADSAGPTARWKGFYFDLDWKKTQARPGAGYGGTQASAIVCYTVAEARKLGMDIPMFAGGGVFSHKQALKIMMAGSDMVQLGTVACSGGVSACTNLIKNFDSWMDENGYKDIDSLKGDALNLYSMTSDVASKRTALLGEAYKTAAVDSEKCIGCNRCEDVCWHDAISVADKKAIKKEDCIGCGYCFQVCPTKALNVDADSILSSVF